jgi:hypothetical protein
MFTAEKRWNGHGELQKRPEEIAAASLRAAGSQCSWCEGGSMNLLMKAAALDFLAEKNHFNDRADAVRRYFEAQSTLLAEYKAEILECIRTVSRDRLERNMAEILGAPSVCEAYPRVNMSFLIALSHTISAEDLVRITDVFMAKPYEYRAGWPDLTVNDDAGLSFVEVKTTDNFHASQLRFAAEVAAPLGLKCSVIRLKPLP